MASIPEATVIPISAIFPFVTDTYRSTEAAAAAAESGSNFYKNSESEWATHTP